MSLDLSKTVLCRLRVAAKELFTFVQKVLSHRQDRIRFKWSTMNNECKWMKVDGNKYDSQARLDQMVGAQVDLLAKVLVKQVKTDLIYFLKTWSVTITSCR